MNDETLSALIGELASRPRHNKVGSLIYTLLTSGLGADSTEILFEKQIPEVCGRIDAMLGRTVFEFKSDWRRERDDAERQLARYLPEREAATGQRFVGVAGDGATFAAYEMRDGALSPLGAPFAPDPGAPRATLLWLESVVCVTDRLPPDVPRIQQELGRQSLAFHRAFADLSALWARLANDPEVRLKRALWDRLLAQAYGDEVGGDALFLQHTYLSVVAVTIATAALTETGAGSAETLLSGERFRGLGVFGAVEEDFFSWPLRGEGGPALVERLARHVERFDFTQVETDVLKSLYEGLIDPEQRHDLGEYYTPDWLADRVVAAAVRAPLEERVLDPACGSGAFLFHAVRRILSAAQTAGLDPAGSVERALALVAGVDVHPVAVTFARATILLALAPTLRLGRPARIVLPVYLGDALQWNTASFLQAEDLEIRVPPDREGGSPAVLRLPAEDAAQPGRFDEVVETLTGFAEQNAPAPEVRGYLDRQGVAAAGMWLETYSTLARLRAAGRDHIWGYVARNLSRPLWLSSPAGRADVLVGNPPWVAYRSMSGPTQEKFREMATKAGLFVAGKSATANDLSAYFFARAVELYMKPSGRAAFVMPYAALSRQPYAKFRKGDFRTDGFQGATVRFTEAWALAADVGPLFPVPACVLFAERTKIVCALPKTVRAFHGWLPRRDASPAEANRALTETVAPWPDDGDGAASPYKKRFLQGATLVPRRFVIVEELPVTGRLGGNPAAPMVRGRVTNLDKKPWSDVPPLEGPVEREFLRPVLLGESVAPYRVLTPALGVIPMTAGRAAPLDAGAARARGALRLAEWLRKAEAAWDAHGRGKLTFAEQLDYMRKLRAQFPVSPVRIVYTKAGKQAAASIITDKSLVIDHKLYWSAVLVEEARYLVALFNSEEARSRAKHWQSTGQWGARDFDRVMLNLPIPRFDAKKPLHRDLAAAAGRAAAVAAATPLEDGDHFTRARRRIRDALAESGVGPEIDRMVARLLDGA